MKGLDCEERLRKLNLPTLVYGRLRGDMNKIVHDVYDPSVVSNLLALYQGAHCVGGHNFKLAKKSSRLDLRKYAITNRMVTIWNGLPTSVVNEKSTKHF